MNIEVEKLSDVELREILLTVDGKGKSVKEQALHELIERARLVEIMMLASIPT